MMEKIGSQLDPTQLKKPNPLYRKPTICIILIPLSAVIVLLTVFEFVEIPKSKFWGQRVRKYYRAPVVTQEEVEEGTSEIEEYTRKKGSGYLRLPDTIRPSYYKLTLTPWLDPDKDWKVDGSVSILITCLKTTNQIILHSLNITITSTHLLELDEQSRVDSRKGTNGLGILKTEVEEKRKFLVVTLKENLEIGKEYELTFEFNTTISDDTTGFYRSSYLDKDTNDTKYLGVTQFEPTAARKTFPCFDEPHLKAIFEIIIARKVNMSSVSNSPISKMEPHGQLKDWVWDYYEPTLPMSTYLVAFVISDFVYQETTFGGSNGQVKTFRVWSRPDVLNQTNYALSIGPKLLGFFETYFGVEYPWTKMDILAVPDFDNAGMENWGLILLQETEMLYDPLVTSKSAQNTIASTISHEISHQWFGNLVTPRWWSDIWLNEGFASYFEYVGVNHIEPSWHKMDMLVVDEMEDVFMTDALDFTRPISIPVEDPDDIEEQFDGISYSKGAAIIGMINAFLSPDTFRNGLRSYLITWKYNNTDPADLWDAFTVQAQADGRLKPGVSVGDIMSTWTLQRGFPLVQVTRDYDGQAALFTQSKYQLLTNGGKKKVTRWWIPISYASPRHNSNFNQTSPVFWMSPSDETVEEKIPAGEYDWFVVNVNSTGYFRINYDMRNWQMVSNQLKVDPGVIPVLNRAQILDDCLSFAQSGLVSYAFAFSLGEYLRLGEGEFAPWQAYLNGLQHISYMLQLTPAYTYFQSYIRRLIGREYSKVVYSSHTEDGGGSFLPSLHQQSMVLWATSSNHPDSIQQGRQYFNASLQAGKSIIPPNFRKPMYCSIVENGGTPEWNFLWKEYREATRPTEIKTLIQGLACTTDLSVLSEMLRMALDPNSEVREQDCLLFIKEVAINPIGTDLVFKLLSTNWTSLQNYLSNVDVLISVIGDQFNTEDQLKQWLLFKTRYGSDLGSTQRAVYQSIERVKSNIDWMSTNYETVYKLLKHYVMH